MVRVSAGMHRVETLGLSAVPTGLEWGRWMCPTVETVGYCHGVPDGTEYGWVIVTGF